MMVDLMVDVMACPTADLLVATVETTAEMLVVSMASMTAV
jgi:hypothetical protein